MAFSGPADKYVMKKQIRALSNKKRPTSILPMAAFTLGAALSGGLAGCGGASNGGDFAADFSSTTVDQGAGFTITPTFLNNVSSTTHVFGAFSSPCAIATKQAATDQKCMVNARETDVYANEMQIGINIPAGMCKYFESRPYFYYNYRPGNGPTAYAISTTDGILTSCTVGGAPGVVNNGVCTGVGGGVTPGRAGRVTSNGAVACGYDYSQQVPAGPNCCIGSYSLVTTTTTSATSTAPSVTNVITTTGTYSGIPGSCIAGPGASKLWPVHVANGSYKGFPGAVLTKVPEQGYKTALENRIPEVYVQGASDTISVSNFRFNWSAYLAAGNLVSAALPAAIDPSSITDGGGFVPTSDAWEFLCEDEAREVIHRITLYVNEWDTDQQLTTYLASGGTAGNPSNADSDREGTACFGGGISYGYCNDFFSLRDYVTGTYGSGRPLLGPIGYFPFDAINDAQNASAN